MDDGHTRVFDPLHAYAELEKRVDALERDRRVERGEEWPAQTPAGIDGISIQSTAPDPETPNDAYRRVIIDAADLTARHERMAEAMHADNREYLLSEGMPATSVPIWPDTDPKMRARWRNLARVADAARGE